MENYRQGDEVWKAVLLTVVCALIVMVILLLSSCRSSKQVEQHTVFVHDTVRTHVTDTVEKTRKVMVTDTVHHYEFHYVYPDSGGRLKEVHIYNNTEKVREVDSTHHYSSRIDSLQRAVNELRADSKELTVVKKVIPRWVWLICVLSVMMLFGYVFIVRKRIKRLIM